MSQDLKLLSFEELQKKIAILKEDRGVDLSTEEDLSIAVMNLISLEEHFFFSGAKTGKDEYYNMLMEVREMRKVLLARMIDKTEAESWCISKHLLATTMRLMEVGTKLQGDGKTEDAKQMFTFAYKVYNLFFGLRLKIINIPDIKNNLEAEKPMTFDDIMGKLVDCCKE
ncbi:MAG: hypothetical protein UR25_C0001G0033 [Candidatus Nomurabacteria bacterium GW2011_GWE1_32_28]|uniref:Uncharacterized protein n=1 Tax=Candidatus Nomurabacteria bacterium GW2011_GWF1_31_48 TaxID=1618767 RepID=A0A0G0BFV2_9BACT|nr:MAG: hypothetical protein UR10_C0005G0015 [Candidatus Nomurabacteria bacterium GW2011_GWF2_30_133]KKP28367.1 MAG: hypothetical protein UR18_C0005G0015 [Candidatus Nomurabacteria bacterium GW2011_GWE2_31_40]KKP29952.1 MAG: hypothetical protein UR19_C0006G0015 [Candidatus Nomurabacteria bacterium GW2011_GWF1_31_48]KKP35121.1 MAG: hypothetical protein UR25_C0001G0033 [Candidatus Nomurabacteria bacterium GW2011_GWE1_32_28]HAS80933.1 hypothetical protein [Candidatus Nomurabacteria bacterium]